MTTITRVGGPTVLIELDGWRILTDPTFDPPGRRYQFGWGTSSVKTAGPALSPDQLGPIDVILLSHDHHADNLDDTGRALLPGVPTLVTTRSALRRLAVPGARGLGAGETTRVQAPGRPDLTIRATPCRHGPPLSRLITGDVVGFSITVDGRPGGGVWMTGDTVLYRPLLAAAASLDVDVLLLHLGSVKFPVTGPVRYSMQGTDATTLIERTNPRHVVPVHYEGWSHFSEPITHLRATLAGTPPGIRNRIHWLDAGIPTSL